MTKTIADLIAARFGIESEAGRNLPPEGALNNLLNHRTHRRYTDEPISDEALEIILACALSAPSKSDLQQLSIINVKDPVKRRTIAECIPNMPYVGSAPVFLLFCADGRRIRRICELRGKEFVNDTLETMFNATVDAALAMQAAMTAAAALGLGTCAISHVRDHLDTVRETCALPDGVFPVAGLTLGHPSQDGWISLRLPPAVTVHDDTYDDSDLAEQLDAYDGRRDSVFSIPPERYKSRERYDDPAFYGWSEDKSRQMAERETADLRRYLEAHGYALE